MDLIECGKYIDRQSKNIFSHNNNKELIILTWTNKSMMKKLQELAGIEGPTTMFLYSSLYDLDESYDFPLNYEVRGANAIKFYTFWSDYSEYCKKMIQKN